MDGLVGVHLWLFRDLASSDGWLSLYEWEWSGNLNGGLDLLWASVLLEDDESLQVFLEASNVSVEAVLRLVDTTSVNGDAELASTQGVELNGVQFSERETLAEALIHVVLDSAAVNDWAEGFDWSWEHLFCSLDASLVSAGLGTWLVEPCLDQPWALVLALLSLHHREW